MPTYELDADGVRLVVTTNRNHRLCVVFVDNVTYSFDVDEPHYAERMEESTTRVSAGGSPGKTRITRVPIRAIEDQRPRTIPRSDQLTGAHDYQVQNGCVRTPEGWIADEWEPDEHGLKDGA